MRWLGILLAIAFITVSSILNKKLKCENRQTDDGIIKPPRYYLYVGVSGVVAFVAIALIFFIAQNDIVAGVIMMAVSIPYTVLIIYAVNWKIKFDNNGFSLTNIVKKQKYYLYSSVTIINTGRGLRIYTGKKKIAAFSFLFANVDNFYHAYNDSHN